MTATSPPLTIGDTDATILRLLAEGYSQAEAAEQLHFNRTAVTKRLQVLRDKLGLVSIDQVLVWAGQTGVASVRAVPTGERRYGG